MLPSDSYSRALPRGPEAFDMPDRYIDTHAPHDGAALRKAAAAPGPSAAPPAPGAQRGGHAWPTRRLFVPTSPAAPPETPSLLPSRDTGSLPPIPGQAGRRPPGGRAGAGLPPGEADCRGAWEAAAGDVARLRRLGASPVGPWTALPYSRQPAGAWPSDDCHPSASSRHGSLARGPAAPPRHALWWA